MLVFDVDFNGGLSPGPAPFPASQPTSVVGLPQIVQSLGTLTDKPLRFYRDESISGQYQQLQFVPPASCGHYLVDFDLYVATPDPGLANNGFKVLFDSPSSHSIWFRSDETIQAILPGDYDPELGAYAFDTEMHVSIQFGLNRRFKLAVDGVELWEGGPFPVLATPVSAIRIGTQSVPFFETGFDNLEIVCTPVVLPSSSPPGIVALIGLLVLGGARVLGQARARRVPRRPWRGGRGGV